MLNKLNTLINVPKNMKILVIKGIKKKIIKIFLKSKNKKYIITYKNNVFIDKWCNVIILQKSKFNRLNLKNENKIKNFLKSINIYFYDKIKFKGKGFRIKFFKKVKLIKFYFGRSHKTFLFLKKIGKKRINKYKFILFNLNKNNLKKIVLTINNIKRINFYTLRGLRSSRQIIFKRKGKKGTYI